MRRVRMKQNREVAVSIDTAMYEELQRKHDILAKDYSKLAGKYASVSTRLEETEQRIYLLKTELGNIQKQLQQYMNRYYSLVLKLDKKQIQLNKVREQNLRIKEAGNKPWYRSLEQKKR